MVVVSTNIRESSFNCCCCDDDDIAGGRMAVFIKSFRRLGSAFICVLKNPVIFVCDRILSALPFVTQLVPEIMVAGDLKPFVRFESFIVASHSDVVAVVMFEVTKNKNQNLTPSKLNQNCQYT